MEKKVNQNRYLFKFLLEYLIFCVACFLSVSKTLFLSRMILAIGKRAENQNSFCWTLIFFKNRWDFQNSSTRKLIGHPRPLCAFQNIPSRYCQCCFHTLTNAMGSTLKVTCEKIDTLVSKQLLCLKNLEMWCFMIQKCNFFNK